MRLFISINFDKQTKSKIIKVQDNLRRLSDGNYSRRDNLHLTLAFLGEVEEERVPELKELMSRIHSPKVTLSFNDIGYFTMGKKPDSQLWWIGIKENPLLNKMQAELCRELKSRGFWFDNQKFKPHITLARKLHLKRWDKKELLPRSFECQVNRICLMQSHIVDGVLTYTKLYSQEL